MLQFSLALVAARLKEERKRLGHKTQESMAMALKIPARTYWDREKGNVPPDAEFLARFCELGGDALYLLTGNRTPLKVTDGWEPYSPAERSAAMIQGMSLSAEDAELLVAVAKRLAKSD